MPCPNCDTPNGEPYELCAACQEAFNRNEQETEEESEPQVVTVLALAEFILGRKAETGQDFEDAGLPIMGGCEVCHATIAAYNAAPSKTGYLRCADGCIGSQGYSTVQEAALLLFPELFEVVRKVRP